MAGVDHMTRVLLTCIAVVSLAQSTHAGQMVFGWDWPREKQADTVFTLYVRSQENSVVAARRILVAPWARANCEAHHRQGCPSDPGITGVPSDCTFTEDTMCSEVCLTVGKYSMTLTASGGATTGGAIPPPSGGSCVTAAQRQGPCRCTNQTCENAPHCANCPADELTCTMPLCPGEGGAGGSGGESNVLDVDVTVDNPTGACHVAAPAPPPPPPRPAPIPPPPPITPPGSGEAPNPFELVNLRCVQWRILGPCMCNPYTPCTTVEYWEPAYLIETVKKPGDTVLLPFFSGLLNLLPTSAWGGGGAGNTTGAGHTNIHYNEVHVFKFPQILGGPCRSGNSDTTLYFASEIDPLWKTATGLASFGPETPLNLRDIGVWAKLYPRGGKVITGSEPVGSGVGAIRGMDIAANPVGMAIPPDAHVVLNKAPSNPRCCQMGFPKQTGCFPAGTNPARWEQGTGSRTGRYIWILWEKRTCCTQQVTSGITIIGGYGASTCDLAPPSQ